MNEKDIERTERYLRHELSSEERSVFENKMEADSSFRQEVELHSRAVYAAKLKGRQQMKVRLQQRKPPAGKGRLLRAWLLVTVLLVLAVPAVFLWKKTKTVEPRNLQENGLAPIPLDTSKSLNVPQVDSALVPIKEKNAVQPQNSPPPIVDKKLDTDRLFAAYFTPYKDEGMNPTVRTSAEKLTAFDKFQQAYWEGRYDEALKVFGTLAPASQNSDNLLFIKANALMATDKGGEAVIILEKITANGRSNYIGEARWYLALAHLQKGAVKKSQRLLQAIADDSASPQYANAKKLLKQME